MIRVGLFLRTQKGYGVLSSILERYPARTVAFVVSTRDAGMKKDYYKEIRDCCRNHRIPFLDQRQVKSAAAISKGVSFVLAAGWNRMINGVQNLVIIHDSLLPKYRGFAPLVNMLVAGERWIGATAILATKEYDRGPILLQRRVRIHYPMKIQKAIALLSGLYGQMAIRLLSLFSRKKLSPRKQPERLASYSPWLDQDDYRIDWSWPAEKIKRFIDATGDPYFGAEAAIRGQTFRIWEAETLPDILVVDRQRHLGKVIFLHDHKPVVICGSGLLRIDRLETEQGKPATVRLRTRFL